MKKSIREWITSAAFSLFPTFLIWLPFIFRMESIWTIPLPKEGMATIVANYDGPLFLVIAKTFYNQELIKNLFQFPLPTEYYAAHFPLFPFLIKLFSFAFGHVYSMLFVTLASSVLAIWFFRKLIRDFVKEEHVNWLTFIFSVFPARWLIVRSVGSAEPLFVAAAIASVYFFRKRKFVNAGVWGMVAQLTKSPGILLFAAFFLSYFFEKIKSIPEKGFSSWVKTLNVKKFLPIFLIPLSLVLLFAFYGFRMGDFFAYFNSGDNIHLFFPPFQIFNYSAPWVGTYWLEEIIFIYLLIALSLSKLIRKGENEFAWFLGVFLVSILFVAHRDLIRYALPVVPFSLVAFSDTLKRNDFKYIFLLILLPIFLFSISYISQNVMPIANWAPFL